MNAMLKDTIPTFDYINDNRDRFFKAFVMSSQNYLIYEDKELGTCLLFMTRPKDDRHFPEELCPPGGKHDPLEAVNNGKGEAIEDPSQAAKRETREEFGIDVKKISKFGSICNPRGTFINLLVSEINEEDLKNLNPCKIEVGSICLLSIEKLRTYKIENKLQDCKYDPKCHLPEYEKGFSVEVPIMKIRKSDFRILWGEIEKEEVVFRPQGYFELERTVLSRVSADPEFSIANHERISACYNLMNRIKA